MSITPSTSKSFSHTLVGEAAFRTGKLSLPISLVVLGRGSRLLKPQALEELEALGAGEILSIEEKDSRPDFDVLKNKNSTVRYLMLGQSANLGQMLNAAFEEARGDWVFVLWSDQTLGELSFYSKTLRTVEESAFLCSVPELRDRQGGEIPNQMVPSVFKHQLQVLPLAPQSETRETLYPFDFTGLYNRQKFRLCGGFDPKIESPYWQLLDFGLRAHLWGERLGLIRGLRIQYRSDLPLEDRGIGPGYSDFYLKNLALRFSVDQGVLPGRSFWRFWRSSGMNFWQARQNFNQIKAWVHTHRYRFKWDAPTLADLWGSFS